MCGIMVCSKRFCFSPRGRSEEHTSELQSLPLSAALPIYDCDRARPSGLGTTRFGGRLVACVESWFVQSAFVSRRGVDRKSTRLNSSHFHSAPLFRSMIATAHGHPVWGQLALAGGLLHVWNHGLFKALLFLGAGSVLHATGTREMSRLGGLWRAMPWTAGLFVLGAMAISGLPPLNGFVSEWLVFLGLFDAVSEHGVALWAAAPAALLLGLTGALALACFVKVCGIVFLGQPRAVAQASRLCDSNLDGHASKETHRRDACATTAHECGWRMRVPMLVLAGLCAAIGLAPALFWPAIANASAAWQPAWVAGAPPAPLITLGSFHIAIAALTTLAVIALWRRVRQNGVERAGTWDCG